MFDSKNLPLSPLKPLKKTISRIVEKSFSSITFIIVFAGAFYWQDRSRDNNILVTLLSSQVFSWMLIAFICVALLLISFIYLYEYLYYKSYYYSFKNEGGEIKKGVFSKSTGHVRYERLQNIYVDQDFLDRIFGLYDVHYETAGETSGFYSHVDGLNKENSEKLISFLNKKTTQDYADKKIVEVAAQTHSASSNDDTSELGKILISRKNYPISPTIIKVRVWTMIVTLFVPAIFIIFGSILSMSFGSNSDSNDSFSAFLIFYVVVCFILCIGAYYYYKEWFKNLNYQFGYDKAEIFTKVIGQSSSYLYYDRIQNVMVNQGIVDRMFGLYVLVIETAGESSGRSLKIEGFEKENAEKVKDFIIEKSRKHRKNI